MSRELKVLVIWEKVLHQILDATQHYPKAVRHSFVHRIDGLVLDITQTMVSAQYSPMDKQVVLLEQLNIQLAQLKLLLRVSADRKYVSLGLLRDLIHELDGIGMQIYAWQENNRALGRD